MTKFIARKRLGSLFPVDQIGEDCLRKIKTDDLVQVEVRRPRNIQHHRKFFALLVLVHENQSRYASVEELLDAIKVHVGHCETMFLRDGTEVKRPKSIAFHKMNQYEFDDFYKRVLDVVASEIIPGIQKDDLRREVEGFLSA